MVFYLYNYVGVGKPGEEKVKLRLVLREADVNFQLYSRIYVSGPFNFFKCALSFKFDRFIFKMYDYVYIFLPAAEEC